MPADSAALVRPNGRTTSLFHRTPTAVQGQVLEEIGRSDHRQAVEKDGAAGED